MSMAGLLEGPVYTRPRVWRGREVPDVLLSGDHAAIARWRRDAALLRTAANRPDLIWRAAADPGTLSARDWQVLSAMGLSGLVRRGMPPGTRAPGSPAGRGPGGARRDGSPGQAWAGTRLAYQSAPRIWHTEGRCVLSRRRGPFQYTGLALVCPHTQPIGPADDRSMSTEESLPCTPLLPN